jgi:hypothetical protein
MSSICSGSQLVGALLKSASNLCRLIHTSMTLCSSHLHITASLHTWCPPISQSCTYILPNLHVFKDLQPKSGYLSPTGTPLPEHRLPGASPQEHVWDS